MPTRLSFSVLLCSALLFLASPAFSAGGSAASGEGVSPRCEAAIDKAAGNYSQCLLKASAKFAKRGNEDRLLAQQAKCDDKFDAQVARAQDRYGEDQCTRYTSQIADRTATYAQGAATEASGKASPSFLFVQNGTGGTLSEDTLTLTGVSAKTTWFTDRPYRVAGQLPTAEFLSFWDEGENSFSEDAPTADFTCTIDEKVVNYVVELNSPSMAGGDLSYSVNAVSGQSLPQSEMTCEADSQLFVDSFDKSKCLNMSKVALEALCASSVLDVFGAIACICLAEASDALGSSHCPMHGDRGFFCTCAENSQCSSGNCDKKGGGYGGMAGEDCGPSGCKLGVCGANL